MPVGLWVLLEESFEIVSFTATNVDNQDVVDSTGEAGQNFGFDWKPVNPVFPGASISGHESVERRQLLRVAVDVLEVSGFGFERPLEGAVGIVGRACVAVSAKIVVEFDLDP